MAKITESSESVSGIDSLEDYTPFLASELVAYASAHGANIRLPEDGVFTHLPMTLFPFKFSSGLFEFAKLISPIYNKLVDRISRNQIEFGDSKSLIKEEKDASWLSTTLEHTIKTDEFTRRLFEIYVDTDKLRVAEDPNFQHFSLGINRSDYMVHDDPGTPETERELLQVEINTIASSFGCMAEKLSAAHRFVCAKYPEMVKVEIESLPEAAKEDINLLLDAMPDNEPMKIISTAIAKAHQAFTDQLKLNEKTHKVAVLMIVQDGEKNSFDQKLLEYAIYEQFGVNLIRKSLAEINSQGSFISLKEKSNILKINDTIISVAYFRAGYTPNDYKSESDWDGRKLVEKSFAVKCPNIAYHLAGTKKVQQHLAKPGEVEKFLAPNEAMLIRRSFARLWTLDVSEQSPDDIEAENNARSEEKCKNFVLKPQREGGGNNFYGKQIIQKLNSMTDDEKAGYILMQRIFPEASKVTLIRKEGRITGNGVCELGVFGAFLGDNTKESINEYGGYLCKIKLDGVDEGGVYTGYACLGSVYLN